MKHVINNFFLKAGLLLLTLVAASGVVATESKAFSRVSVHDPSIVVSKEGEYYVFGSHIDAAKSTDLMNWSSFSNLSLATNSNNTGLYGDLDVNLKKAFAWAGQNDVDSRGTFSVWAPDVIWNEKYKNSDGTTGAYMIYFCTTSTYIRSTIAFAVSKNIEGPYTFVNSSANPIVYSGFTKTDAKDTGSSINKKYTNTNIDELISAKVLKDGLNNDWFSSDTRFNNYSYPNALDPNVFEDKDGKLWMTYGSWSGGIFILELDPATGGAKYPGKNVTGLSGDRFTDEYFGTHIAGGQARSGEGPYVIYDKDSDYYYLYMSYYGLQANGGYQMRLFRSKTPDGPYLDATGIKVMGNYKISGIEKPYKAEGHNSAFIDPKDNKKYLVYHTRFDDSGELHQVRVHQQFINDQGWPVTAVYEHNSKDVISEVGYDKGELVGEYEFINHGTSSDGSSYAKPKSLKLYSNGKVTGAAKGTWEAVAGTKFVHFTLDNVTYSGVFFKQTKETSAAKVMTFTAIGSNNQSIWGVKKGVSISLSKKKIYAGGNTNNTAKVNIIGLVENYTATYLSSNKKVATVNSKGLIKAKKKGTATITAIIKFGNVTKTFTTKIKVKKAYIKFTKKKTKLKAKKKFKFKVKGYGIKKSSIKFKSSKKSVLKINKKTGKAIAKKKGKATVIAYYKKIKVKCKVKVKAKSKKGKKK